MARRSLSLLTVAFTLATMTSACASVTTPSAAAPASTVPSVSASVTASTPTPSLAPIASASLGGVNVNVLGLWSGPELDSFMAVKSAWESQTGATVQWTGTHDLETDLAAAVQSGRAPDIAVLPNPGLMKRLAANGSLKPLDAVLEMGQVRADYAPSWIDLGSTGGSLYGIFYKVTNKATVWYDPAAFAEDGYRTPSTWDDLMSLADSIVAHGKTPFSIAGGGGPANGWALTDWISEIVLNKCGPTVYDAWVAAQIPWTDACIKQSFELFIKLVTSNGYVLGAGPGIVATTDATGTYPIYANPPAAYMDYIASFAQAFITSKYPGLKPRQDYGYFAFPSITPEFAGGLTVGADVVVMITDTPAARSLIRYLAGVPAQEAWIRLGGFTSVNRSVALDTYSDSVARNVASDLTKAPLTRFGAGDMMPASVQRAWWQAMLDLVSNPTTLDSTLDSLTSAARSGT
jgi:alpha-glucoside transport system substrate-binding protein